MTLISLYTANEYEIKISLFFLIQVIQNIHTFFFDRDDSGNIKIHMKPYIFWSSTQNGQFPIQNYY